MGQGLHVVSLEQVVSLESLQDGYKVEKAFLVTEQPSDIDDPDFYLCVFCLFLSAETEERFLWDTVIDILLNLFWTQHYCF